AEKRAMFACLLSHVARTNPVLSRPAAVARAVAQGGRVTATVPDVCEAAQLLGRRCGYDERFLTELGSVLEYWDGKGFPGAVRGGAVPPPVRAGQVASVAVAGPRV